VAIYANETEFSRVIQGAMSETVQRLESRQHQDEFALPGSRGKQGKAAAKRKTGGPNFNVVSLIRLHADIAGSSDGLVTDLGMLCAYCGLISLDRYSTATIANTEYSQNSLTAIT
jgi:hypothetical protein